MREIFDDRIVFERDGFQIVIPKSLFKSEQIDEKEFYENLNRVPLFCPVCKRVLRGQNDIDSYREFECCENCDIYWARIDIERWRSGWRPSEEEIETKIDEKCLDIINVII